MYKLSTVARALNTSGERTTDIAASFANDAPGCGIADQELCDDLLIGRHLAFGVIHGCARSSFCSCGYRRSSSIPFRLWWIAGCVLVSRVSLRT